MIQIGSVRFNTETWNENCLWRQQNNWKGCIYGIDKQIPDKVAYGSTIHIIEMNNSTNQIMGIGKIKYIYKSENRVKLYKDENYNRFVYKSIYRIDREDLLRSNSSLIIDMEKTLFKGSRHFKRGHGVIIIPKERFGIIYKEKKRKPVQCKKCGLHGHNSRSCKSKKQIAPIDIPSDKKKCKICGKLEKGHICTGLKIDQKKILNIIRFFENLF